MNYKLIVMAATAAIFLNACSKNTYLPEAHSYANAMKPHLIAHGICNLASCNELIKFNASGIKYHKVEYGRIEMSILGVNSKELADKLLESCAKTKKDLKKPEIVLNLYNVKTLTPGAKPIMSSACN